jgi:hypothetical protein
MHIMTKISFLLILFIAVLAIIKFIRHRFTGAK